MVIVPLSPAAGHAGKITASLLVLPSGRAGFHRKKFRFVIRGDAISGILDLKIPQAPRFFRSES